MPEDFIVVSSRFNDGVEGYWVTGQLRVAGDEGDQPVSVAVAIGWAATEDAALAAVEQLEPDRGRRRRPQAPRSRSPAGSSRTRGRCFRRAAPIRRR